MDALDAVEQILRDARTPMHYRTLTERILKARLWSSGGRTPEATINSRLAVDIQERGADSRFERVAPGTFALRSSSRSTGPAKNSGGLTGTGSVADPPSRKLSVQDIRSLARGVVKDHPEGIRYGQLVAALLDESPATPRNTIQGSVWNLDALFPGEIHKPSRGLYKPREDGSELVGPAEVSSSRPLDRLKEEAFYSGFADWLTNDVGDVTVARELGGSALRSKWGTPDVIGVYKPLPDNRIKFPVEIVSAEIKIDPSAPVVAFGQAVAYRLFSTKTYIAMPDSIAKEDLERLESLCMLFGIGLVLFALNPEQPDFKIRMRAQRFLPDMYFVNEFADGLHRHDREIFNLLFQ